VPPATGRTGERKAERLAVAARPLGDDIAYQPAVVVSRQRHGLARGAADVEPVHPRVPREDHV
jgi:hypothetical protein